jgi:hypothetical protein
MIYQLKISCFYQSCNLYSFLIQDSPEGVELSSLSDSVEAMKVRWSGTNITHYMMGDGVNDRNDICSSCARWTHFSIQQLTWTKLL